MDTNPSISVSHETLLNQKEAMGIESTTSLTTLGHDIPLSKENISQETLRLPNGDPKKLAQPMKSAKTSSEENDTDERAHYPASSKPLYLNNWEIYLPGGTAMGTALGPNYANLFMDNFH